jgi:osmotically-inducible protein OsmY
MTQTLHRSDAELKTAVDDELAWTAGVDNAHIGVAVMDGGVTLSGEVDSYPEKLRAESERREAERTAWCAPGVTNVDNHLRIEN